MFISRCLDINDKGHLTIGGCDTVMLAENYGTPLYVMDEETIRINCRKYKSAIENYYKGNGKILYASKALNCMEICRIINSENLGLDVVSEGELYTALKSGFPAENIHFHGNNKTDKEILMALKSGVGRIVVDNFYELERINSIAKELKKVCNISLRIKPGVDAHTHSFIRTGQIDSKFGFALENGEAFSAVKKANELEHICLKELHCHIGSQIFDVEPFILAVDIMIDFIKDLKGSIGITIPELNLGGGFGIKYKESDDVKSPDEFLRKIFAEVKRKSLENNIPLPYIYVEPGRSIVGEAGITLYTIGNIKEIPNIRTYVTVDGGMCDNPRYALYQSDYTVLVANKANIDVRKKVTIAGRCCESGDLIQEEILIQEPKVGDYLAVLSTGAYNYSMSSNYNRIAKPAIVMVNNGSSRVIVKRQTVQDILMNDI